MSHLSIYDFKFQISENVRTNTGRFLSGPTPGNQPRDLFVISMQQAPLIQILALETMSGPRHRLQALFQDGLPAMNAFAVFAIRDSMQGRVDRFQQLPVVGRHRHHQLFCVGVRGHVRRILGRFSVTLPAVGLGGLNLPD